MRKRLQRALSTILAVVFVMSLVGAAGAAGELKLTVNGAAAEADLLLQDGTTLIELGNLEAINGAEVPDAAAKAVIVNGKKYVPLRAVAESLGFTVHWTPESIALERVAPETIDGMTAMDVLVKSTQASQQVNTYSMAGTVDQEMAMEMDGEAEAVKMTHEIVGQFQNEPLKMYMKQIVSLPEVTPEDLDEEAAAMLDGMEVEIYLDEEFMYTRMPGQEGWLKQPHFLPVELLKEQQQLSTDPLKAAEEMLTMGYAPSFGKNVVIDGRECYTVHATIDMAKAFESQQETLRQVIGSIGQATVNELGGEMDPAMAERVTQAIEAITQKILTEGIMDYRLTMYVDKETFLPAGMDLYLVMKLDLNVQELLQSLGDIIGEDVPEELADIQGNFRLETVQQGEIRVFDYGKEFVTPDLSNVIDLNAAVE